MEPLRLSPRSQLTSLDARPADTITVTPNEVEILLTKESSSRLHNSNTVTTAPITKNQQWRLLKGIQQLSNKPDAMFFAQPVSNSQMRLLNIPHYLNIIKKPMDLRTMEERLKDGKYASIDEYTADFDQMIENSLTFNGPGHYVTKHGYNLKAAFMEQVSQALSSTSGDRSNAPAEKLQKGRPRKWRRLERELAKDKVACDIEDSDKDY